MSQLVDRISDIARRCGDLSPIRDDVHAILIAGNRERSLAAEDVEGNPFARVAPRTLRRNLKRGYGGPPLAPRGTQSREITGYVVDVQAGQSRLSFAASWPGQEWMEFHATGTSRMPARSPYGFREQDLAQIRTILRAHVLGVGDTEAVRDVTFNGGGSSAMPLPPSGAPASRGGRARRWFRAALWGL